MQLIQTLSLRGLPLFNILLSLTLTVCVLALTPFSSLAIPPDPLQTAIQSRILQTSAAAITLHQQVVQTIYSKTSMQPLWVTDKGLGPKAVIMLEALRQADKNGLKLEHKDLERIKSLEKSQTPDDLANLDILLSTALVDYLVSSGALAANSTGDIHPPSGNSPPAPKDILVGLIESALATADFQSFLANLLPQSTSYNLLTTALHRYQQLADNGGWQEITVGKSIHPGTNDPRISAIRKRLRIEGFLDDLSNTSTRLDDKLVDAVKEFQYVHGLEPDGIIGKSTIIAMNIPASDKLRSIRINLKRMRELPRTTEGKYILVNIPSFTLYGIEGTTATLTMPVVVGTAEHQTPEFRSEIHSVEFNPAWNIPPKIAREEILEELRKNPHHLNANHIRIYSNHSNTAIELNPLSINWHQIRPEHMGQYRLRQDPGKWNALGAIKFSFPNRYSIYMHDTPSRSLFHRPSRAYSHGCIRLGRPVDLALFLLSDQKPPWTEERIQEITGAGRHVIVNLSTPLPVLITYLTVTTDQNGTLLFHHDIYDRDVEENTVQLFKAPNNTPQELDNPL